MCIIMNGNISLSTGNELHPIYFSSKYWGFSAVSSFSLKCDSGKKDLIYSLLDPVKLESFQIHIKEMRFVLDFLSFSSSGVFACIINIQTMCGVCMFSSFHLPTFLYVLDALYMHTMYHAKPLVKEPGM